MDQPSTDQPLVTYLYWEGPQSALIELCWESVQRHCKNVKRLSKDDAADLLHPPAAWHRFERPESRADYVRAALLSQYGGVWLDSDVVVLKPLDFLPPLLLKHSLVAVCPYKRLYPEIGFLAAQKGDWVMTEWFMAVERFTRNTTKTNLRWSEIGCYLLYQFSHLREWHCLQWDYLYLFNGRQKQRFFEPPSIDFENRYAVMLFNQGFPDYVKHLTRTELLSEPTNLGSVLRASQNQATKGTIDAGGKGQATGESR